MQHQLSSPLSGQPVRLCKQLQHRPGDHGPGVGRCGQLSFVGHRLRQETRLALFQHSADARSRTQLARSQPTRVGFGEQWLKHSVIELLHDQIARFRPIMISRPDEDPMQVLARGEIPLLSALRMHNGTVWPESRLLWRRQRSGTSANRESHFRPHHN